MEKAKESQLNSYLTFRVGNEEFAANVSQVLNILEMPKVTAVPKSPVYMKGVINLRGTVLPVVDTKIKFGLGETEFTTNTCVLVLEVDMDGERVQVGAIVDSVQEVIEIDEKQIQPPPSIGSKYRSEFILGMYQKNENNFVMILDMNLVFTLDELTVIKDSTPSEAVAD